MNFSTIGYRETAPDCSGSSREKPKEEPSPLIRIRTCKGAQSIHVPHTADKVHGTKAGRKAFDDVPCAMKLLQRIRSSLFMVHSPAHLFVTQGLLIGKSIVDKVSSDTRKETKKTITLEASLRRYKR